MTATPGVTRRHIDERRTTIAPPLLGSPPIIAIIIAVLIYMRQGDDQRDTTAKLHERFDKQDDLLREVAKRAYADGNGESSRQDSSAGDDSRAQAGADVYTLEGVSVYPRQNIPLRVLGDLVQGWRKQGSFADNDGWLLGEIDRALHKEGARGNHPWRIVLVDRDDPSRRFVWKVSRGGQGKVEPTVTDETNSYTILK